MRQATGMVSALAIGASLPALAAALLVGELAAVAGLAFSGRIPAVFWSALCAFLRF